MKVTQWFDGDVKPIRKGIYQVLGYRQLYKDGYTHWNGIQWGVADHCMRTAKILPMYSYAIQDKKWRGLADKPNK